MPRSYQVDGYHLGRWTNRQRQGYAKGELDVERRRRLEDVPCWDCDTRDAYWRYGFSKLQSYVQSHGDARVPRVALVGAFRLGEWVGAQRTLNTKGQLDPARRAELEGLPGWVWKAREDQWENNFSLLVDYARRHGSACVPVSYADHRGKLGSWVHNQRSQRSRGELDAERERRLQELPGWRWNCLTDAR